MNRLSFLALAALLAAGMQTTQAQQNRAQSEKLLASAHHKATIDGDLKGAIEDYKKIVAGAGANRTLAAQALMRMAECYQKLGDAESRKIYERVTREYSDQKEFAAIAHARLGGAAPATMSSRRLGSVPVGGVGYGTVSPDGRHFPYTNWDNGDLYLRDLVTGSNRRLTSVSALDDANSQFATQAAFSKDGRQVAYSWLSDRRQEIRIVETAGGSAQPRRLFRNEDISNIWPDDWSGDGKWLAVQLIRDDKTAQMGLVGVQDGSLRVLKSVDWRGATRLMFSPDSKYLAYDLPALDTNNQRDVLVLAIDGSRDTAVVAHPANDAVMGWSPDGSSLLFSSDRSGAVGLWRLPVADGRPAGAPELVKPQVEGATLGIVRNGALYSLVHHPRFNAAVSANIQLAAFDFDAGRFLSPPSAPAQQFVGTNNFPVWSPDGRYLAYVSLREGATAGGRSNLENRFVIAIRSAETGEVRELRPGLNTYPNLVRWSADGRSLLTQGRDIKGRQGLYRIDAQNAAVSAIALSTGDEELRSPSEGPNGQNIYYIRGYVGQPERDVTIIERDLRSGTETEVLSGRRLSASGPVSMISPDGQTIVVSSEEAAPRSSVLLAVPAHGGPPREIFQVEQPQMIRLHGWTPNSRAVLVTVSNGFMGGSRPTEGAELWRVTLDGRERRKLDVNVVGMTPFSVHPDGQQIAYGLAEPAKDDEVWVLENFLPKASKQP